MSFILDALRKSEHERQRQTGPALVEVAVAAPKPKPNRWAGAAIALLVVNLVAIGVLLIIKANDETSTTSSTEPAAAATTAAEPKITATAEPAATAAPAPAAQASISQALPQPPVAAPPPVLRPAATPTAGTRNPLEGEVSGYAPAMEQEAALAAAAPPPGPAAVTPSRRGSVVYQSLPEAGLAPADEPAPTAAASNLPRADDMTARGALPELRLELHVWSTKPQERFVFVNGRRYREGDSTAEGATVEEITREGVIMNSGGNRFLLSRE